LVDVRVAAALEETGIFNPTGGIGDFAETIEKALLDMETKIENLTRAVDSRVERESNSVRRELALMRQELRNAEQARGQAAEIHRQEVSQLRRVFEDVLGTARALSLNGQIAQMSETLAHGIRLVREDIAEMNGHG
jgi:hypothetical protein